MRTSRASLALIRRIGSAGETEYLAQWNDGWQAYSLVGGHVEADELYRGCCQREVAEELNLVPDVDFRVAPQPFGPRIEYTAQSQSTGTLTEYQFELFTVELTPAAVAIVTSAPHNRWLNPAEILRGLTADGMPIAEQVVRVLQHIDLLS